MCLTTKQTRWRIAKEDIICYKLLNGERVSLSEIEYTTPFTFTPVPKNVIEGKKCLRAKGWSQWEEVYDCFQITNGAIHACASEHEAWNYYKYGTMGTHIFKCIIPKGTRYAVGLFDDICAKKIKFIKRII